MKRHLNYKQQFTALAVLLGFGLIGDTSFAQIQKIGVNSAVKGRVTIQSGENAAAQAAITEPVFLGDYVNSKSQSTLQVLLLDETTFTVGPNCDLKINEFVYTPNSKTNTLKASVTKGMFRFMSGNISKSNQNGVTIDSPIAELGIRGTILEGLVGPDAIEVTRKSGALPEGIGLDQNGATVFILRGPGPNAITTSRRGEIDVISGGSTVTINQSGYASFVATANSQPTEPFLIPDDIYEQFSKQLRTKPKNNLDYERGELDLVDPLTEMDWPGCQAVGPAGACP